MFLSLIFIGLVAGLNSSQEKNIHSEKIEAKVGKEIITSTDLESMLSAISKSSADKIATDGLKKKALQALIDRALVRIHLEHAGVSITEREVDQKIQSIRLSNGIKNDEEFKGLLSSQGTSFDQLRDQLRFQLENYQFMGLIRRQASRTIEDKDLRAYYQENSKDFSNSVEVELQECVIDLGSNPAAAEQSALSYEKNPKKFDECVKKLSRSPSSSTGGKIGSFQSGILREDVEKAVFQLKAGEVAHIQQPGSIQLLKLLKKTNLGPKTFDSSKEKIRERLEMDLLQKEMEKTLAELRSSTFIQI